MKIIKGLLAISIVVTAISASFLAFYQSVDNIEKVMFYRSIYSLSQLAYSIMLTVYSVKNSRRKLFGLLVLVPILYWNISASMIISYFNELYSLILSYNIFVSRAIYIVVYYVLIQETNRRVYYSVLVYSVFVIVMNLFERLFGFESSIIMQGGLIVFYLSMLFILYSKFEKREV